MAATSCFCAERSPYRRTVNSLFHSETAVFTAELQYLSVKAAHQRPARQVQEPFIWSCGCGRRPRRRVGWRSAAALRWRPRNRRGKRAAAEAAGSSRGLGGGRACSAAGLNVGWLQMVPMVKCAACRPQRGHCQLLQPYWHRSCMVSMLLARDKGPLLPGPAPRGAAPRAAMQPQQPPHRERAGIALWGGVYI